MQSGLERLSQLASALRDLHSGNMLVLPNAWDAASARIVQDEGFPAVATASAAISAMLGYADGEGTPALEMFNANARVARAVSVPVSMDAEGGYGMEPADFVERLLECGAVGCNLEDTDHRGGGLLDPVMHGEWLSGVRAAATAVGVPIVINARVDVYFPSSTVAEEDRVSETVRRGEMYLEAGADCIYPIGVTSETTLRTIIAALNSPINANTGPELDLERLRDLRVARVSYGPSFYRAALAGFATAIHCL